MDLLAEPSAEDKARIDAEIKLSGERVARELEQVMVPKIMAIIKQAMREASAALERKLAEYMPDEPIIVQAKAE